MNFRRLRLLVVFSTAVSGFAFPSLSQDLLPSSVTIITREQINGTPMFSLAEALEGVPSVNLERDGAFGTRVRIKMRGAPENANVIVLLDGRPITHEFDGAVDLSQIPVNIVSRIEITRGGASGAYTGEAVGGAVNIITSRPVQKGMGVRLGTGVGRDGTKTSHGRFFSQSYWGDLTYLGSIEESAGFSINEDSDGTNHFVNATRSFNGKGYLGLEYFFQESDVGVSKGTPVPYDQWNGQLERMPSDEFAQREQEMQHAKVHFMTPELFGGHFYSYFTHSTRDSDENIKPTEPSALDQDRTADTFDVIWRKGAFEWGGQSREMKREQFLLGQTKTRQDALYARYEYAKEKIRVNPSLRVDDHSEFGNFLSPRLAGVAALSENLHFSASASRSFRSPTHDELFISSAVLSNAMLEPEEALAYDAGFMLNPSGIVSLSLTGFYSDLSDMIVADPLTSKWQNEGSGVTRGADIELKWSPWSFLRTSANWTEQSSRVSQPGSISGQAALTPKQLGFARIETDLPRKIVMINELRYESDQFELMNEGGVRIPSHYVWNLRFRAKVWKADLYLDAENLTRRRYAETLGEFNDPTTGRTTVLSPQPERTFWTGISIRFDH